MSINRFLSLTTLSATVVMLSCLLFAPTTLAISSGSAVGVQGTIPSPPPSTGATISTPTSGAVFTTTPITVSGLCPNGLLVKVFANNVFVGSTVCSNGSYVVQIGLFSGRNDIVVRVYDALDQAGPDSNTVSVTFNDSQLAQYGSHVSLSSAYAQRGAAPGTELVWPVILSGGTGPYAISTDWGDGSSTDLLSIANAQTVDLKHTYRVAGIYKIIVKATDKNGTVAYLQLVGQATGAIQTSSNNSQTVIVRQVIWWPSLLTLPLIFVAFWIGRKHKMAELRHQSQINRDL